jgi:tetratricopeptide (TPR) repeat protein
VSDEANPEVFLEKLQQAGTRREVFEHALAALLAHLSPERALLAYRDKENDELSAQASHGLDPQTVFVAGEISTELVKTVMRDRQGMCLVDAIMDPSLGERTSVILSGLRSIVCVPIVHASRLVIGLIYADNRIRAGAFQPAHQDWMEDLACRIAKKLPEVERSLSDSSGRQQPVPVNSVDEEAWNRQRQQAFVMFRDKKVEEAIQELKEVARLAHSFGAKDPRPGRSLGELAEMQRQGQATAEAEKNFIQAIDHLERLGPTYRHELAPVLTNLATLYFAQGNGMRAEGLYRRALEIWQNQIQADDKRLAPLYFNLATLRRAAGAVEEARNLFGKALSIAEKAWGPDHAHVQRCRSALAELAERP